MRILFAEDERSLSRAVTALLEKNNYSVDPVYDGEEALAYLDAGNYDALILDIMMPKLDGLEVLRRLRQAGNPIPVLLLTESIEDTVYETMIYVYDGSLCEMFSRQGRTFHPENGTEISQVSSFEAKLENHLLSLRMEDDNQKTYETKLSIRQ